MKILVSGASGMVGSALCDVLKSQNNIVVRLTRGKAEAGEVFWDPMAGKLDSDALAGVEAVVHLAGENIAGRWTDAKKIAIRESRILGTKTLCDALLKLKVAPNVFISASAIGFYGNRGDELLTESSPPGSGFLPDVCREWEAASDPLERVGIRTVRLRFGVILSRKGGALAKMLTPFKLGVGGVIGSGKQYMSWITLDDVIGVIEFALNNATLAGPVNTVARHAVTNHDFTKTLGKVLNRPTVLPMPAFAARLVFGEMANDLLLGSTRVKPERLTASGYVYKHPELEDALKAAIG